MVESCNNSEQPKVSYLSDVNFNYSLNNRFILSSGLTFMNTGEKIKKTKIIFGNNIDPRLGFIYDIDSTSTSIPLNYKFRYNYYYLQIPLKFKCYFGQKSIKTFLGGGVSADLYLTNRSVSIIEYENGET